MHPWPRPASASDGVSHKWCLRRLAHALIVIWRTLELAREAVLCC